MQPKWILVAVVVGGLLLLWRWGARAGISPEFAREQLKKGALLVDVRTPAEFQAKHLPQAVNLPLGELTERLPQQVPDKSRVILLYCRSGARSARAAQQLRALGYTNALNVGSHAAAERVVKGLATTPVGP